ncbi:MAG: hypothetical protein HYT35_00315 [Candidatus Staskawiczbacteria bacterium]|nr:hypothetical protein [Candidatus Staskawiczbacteria bacterium]
MNVEEQVNLRNYREEYKLVFDGCKFAASLRFITVGFAVSIQSALFAIYSQSIADEENRFNVVVTFMVAMLFLAAPIIVEIRTTSLYRAFRKRGSDLEFCLGITDGIFHRIAEISKRRGKKFRIRCSHTRGIALVYMGILVLWITFLVVTVIQR